MEKRSNAGALAAAARRLLLLVTCCASVVAAVGARADDDLPGRVGRVANLQGVLRHAPDDSAGEWSEIGLNYPIAQGDNLLVDRGGVAEVDYGGGQFRLAGDTNLHVSRLDDRQLALFIAAGRVIVRVRVLDPDDSVRIDTPATQAALTRPGLYRIDVGSDSPLTAVSVREGEAQLVTPSGSITVMPGQTATSTGVGGEPPEVRNVGGIDAFDTWSAARDRVYEGRRNDYVSPQMVGGADLDAYGAWQSYPDYGAVWFPTVDPGWAPYRFGYWTWLSGWGYTWVDQAPWGYAPFHYGRWAYISGRWGWCPGAYVVRPLWAPALVAWYGNGAWSHGPHGPVYGWVPLGWREPFVPWWNGCTDRCLARYNRPYAVNLAERPDARPTHYTNWRVPGGVTAVPSAALMTGGPVASNRVPVRADAASAPTVLARPPAFKPEAPVRPAVRATVPLPAPASALARGGQAAPAASHDATPGPLRIDDGRFVLPPSTPRTIAPAAPATLRPRGAGVAAPAPSAPDRAYRPTPPTSRGQPSVPSPLPLPGAASPPAASSAGIPHPLPGAPTPVAPPSIPRAVPPATVPRAVAPAGSPNPPAPMPSPRSLPVPVPPVFVPAPQVAVPVPQANVPVPVPVPPPASPRGSPGRAAPPNPAPN